MTFVVSPFWTDAVVQQLRGLWAEGHSASEIGRRLGCTKNKVIGKAHRLHLDARKSPIVTTFDKSRLDDVRGMILAGVNQNTIADETGVSIFRIQQARAAGDLPVPRRMPKITLAPLPSLAEPAYVPPVAPKPAPAPVARASSMLEPQTRVSWLSAPASPRSRRNFTVPKAPPKRPLTAAEADMIARFLAERGATQCPAAAADVTTAVIGADDRAAIAAHQKMREVTEMASNAMRMRAINGGRATAWLRS